MDLRTQCKMQNYKNSQRQHRRKSMCPWVWQ